MAIESQRSGLSARAGALEAMRARIASGRWADGSELPAERVLAEELGVARMTLRSALDELVEMGIIEQGRGKKRRVARSRSTLLAQTVGVVSARRVGAHERSFVQTQEYFTQLSAEAVIQEAGYHILVIHPEMLQGPKWRQIIDNRPAGLLWTSNIAEGYATKAVLEVEEQANIPIAVNSDVEAFSGVDRVVHDHEAGGADIARWLIDTGCRNLAAISPMDRPFDWWHRRLQGAKGVIAARGLSPLREIACKVHHRAPEEALTSEFFDRRVRQMVGFLIDVFQGPNPVDGIISVNDPDAIQIAAACRLLKRVPGRDVRIAGYDNLWRHAPELAFEATPPCVTVDKDNPEVGRRLAAVLLDRITNPMVPHVPERVVVPHKLIATA